MYELKKLERYLGVNLLGAGPRLIKKRIYRTAVSQRLRNAALNLLPSDTSGPTDSDLKSSHRFLNLSLPKVCCGFNNISAETVAEGRAGYE